MDIDPFKNFTPRANPPKTEQKDQSPAAPVDIDTLDKLEQMPRNELQKLLQRVLMAGWGYGDLKGKNLVEMALKTKDEAYEALKLAALTQAPSAKDWREFIALATFWAEREKGKPSQAIDVTGKIGIVDIVLQAAKQRHTLLIDSQPVSGVIDNQVIDK